MPRGFAFQYDAETSLPLAATVFPRGSTRPAVDVRFTTLTLARPEGAPAGTRGLAMFLVPKRLPDGAKNGWIINRLKDKFGSRSMASGEVTYEGAVAYVVGEVGNGFKQMMQTRKFGNGLNKRSAATMSSRYWSAVKFLRLGCVFEWLAIRWPAFA